MNDGVDGNDDASNRVMEHAIMVTCGVDGIYALYRSGRVWRWLCDGRANFMARPGTRLLFINRTNNNNNDNGSNNAVDTKQLSVPLQPSSVSSSLSSMDEEFIVKIASGSHHSIALTRTGRVYTWGANHHAQLGNSTTSNKYVFVTATFAPSFVHRHAAMPPCYLHAMRSACFAM